MSEMDGVGIPSSCKHEGKTTAKDSDAPEKECSTSTNEVEELEPSVLGTKMHWEDVYKDEITVFEESGVVDEGWFGSDVETKVLRYVEKLSSLKTNGPILDLGCGNGSLLFELASRDYTNLTGIDYSEAAVKLATALFKSQKYEGKFHVKNILEDDGGELGKFQLCLDKGTFDAISLCPDVQLKDAKAKYFQFVLNALEDDGTFILISCNWTTSELVTLSKEWFQLHEVVPTQQFNFGGQPGNLVSIAVMKKNKS